MIELTKKALCVILPSVVVLLSGCTSAPPLNDEGVRDTHTSYSVADITHQEMVWIPRTGKRYHRNKSCSGMKNPSTVTVEEVVNLGFTPCENCY